MTATTSIETMLNNLETLRLPELQACFKQVVGKATRAPNRKFLMRKIREAAAAQPGGAESPTAPTKAESSSPPVAPKEAARKAKPAAAPAAPKAARKAKAKAKPAAAKNASAPVAPPPAPELTTLTGPLGPIEVGTHAPKKPTPKPTKKAPLRVAPKPAHQPAPEPASDLEPATTDDPESTIAPTRPDLKALSVNDLRTAYIEEVGRPTKSTDRNYLIWKIGQARKDKVPVGPVSRTRSATGEQLRVLPLRMPNDTVEALDDVWRRHSLSSRMDMFRCALRQYLTSLDEHEAAALVR